MGSATPWVIALEESPGLGEAELGGKAAMVAKLNQANLHIANGFCLTTAAYRRFVSYNALERVVALELGRKPLESMRWEELWDAALRIRSAFSKAIMPPDLAASISAAHQTLGLAKNLAVRSSAPGEDSAQASFAGVHESVLDVSGGEALLRAVRLVWASLWSDAALLYRRELSLDPMGSSMAVLVQELVDSDVSGVAFSRDPADPVAETAVLEAVPGRCSNLVDGLLEPDCWTLNRTSGEVLDWRPGRRGPVESVQPLLADDDVKAVYAALLQVESLTGDAIDLEWTGRAGRLTLLQARPISTTQDDNETRRWYLSLRPAPKQLKELSDRVATCLIPELEALGRRFAAEDLSARRDNELADALVERLDAVEHWRKVYRDDFIPFAHGVRQLALFYNDHVRPEDPYEFVGLLKGENLLAVQRNERIEELWTILEAHTKLYNELRAVADLSTDDESFKRAFADVRRLPGGARFLAKFDALLKDTMDVTFGDQRLASRPELLLHHLIEFGRRTPKPNVTGDSADMSPDELERRFFSAVDSGRQTEAQEILAIGRLSWRLRDDDNLLLARLEAQLLRALGIAGDRLQASSRLGKDPISVKEAHTTAIAGALRDRQRKPLLLADSIQEESRAHDESNREKPRQLVGQPAAPGMVSGTVRIIDNAQDLQLFRAGEVLVCRAIEPTMTHLVPLARAIVELRGGMLIHGAIIARELGIACVNGVPDVIRLLNNGDLVTVDGYLGIVTVGAPEFDIEGVDLGPVTNAIR